MSLLTTTLQNPISANQTAMDAAASAGASPVFWAIVIGYFTLVLGFGAWFARFNRSTSDFFFGGRRFSWWLIMMSIVATGVGSHSFLKYSSKAFEHGFSSTMTYLNDWFFMPLFIFGWLPIIYFMRVRSIPEYFERRFGRGVRLLATVSLLIYMLGYIGIGFLTMARTLEPILASSLGWDLMTIISVVAVVAGVYITFGGQTAVIFTDLLQGFILLFAGAALLFLGMDWFGGPSEFWVSLPQEWKLPLANFNDDPGFNFIGIFWQDAVAGSIGFLFMNQGLIMRFMACRSVSEGRKAAAANILIMMPLSAIAVGCAGWIGRGMVTKGALPADLPLDDVFVRVTSLLTTKAGFGFFVAAVTAALMSTVDTLINAVAAVFINDVYRPLVRDREDRHYLRAAMFVSAGATVLGVLAAWAFTRFETVYEAHGFFHSTLTPPLVAAIFLGIFWRRFTKWGAIAVFVLGASFMLLGRSEPMTWIRPLAQGIPASMESGKQQTLLDSSRLARLEGQGPSAQEKQTQLDLADEISLGWAKERDSSKSSEESLALWEKAARSTAAAAGLFPALGSSPSAAEWSLLETAQEFAVQDLQAIAKTPFKYIGAFFNLLVCFGVGIFVSLLTSSKQQPSSEGLTIWSIEAARRIFKGGKPNDRKGEILRMEWKVDPSLPEGLALVAPAHMSSLAADSGDFVYLCDARAWLGGLRSAHGRVEPGDVDPGTVIISQDLFQAGHFLAGKSIKIEVEI